MFDRKRLKTSYVGIVHIFDLKSKKVLLEGGGHFDVENRKLDVLFDCSEVYKDVEWVPILRTEEGFFCPAQTRKGHLIGSGIFTYDHRSKFDMSSFVYWRADKGLAHITENFDLASVQVAGLSGGYSFAKRSKDGSAAEMISQGVFKEIENWAVEDLAIKIQATYSSDQKAIQQRVHFTINTVSTKLTWASWLPLMHAFRLYWLIQHERTDCETLDFSFGDSLHFVTDMMQLRGFDDGTAIVEKGLRVDTPMNAELLARTVNFFLNYAGNKGYGGIEFAFYRLLGYRFGSGTKRVGDDLLDLVFALDGFCADINKGAQRKLSKSEKEAVRQSISKVLEIIDQNKSILDPQVYSFYYQAEEKIFEHITHKPYRERVQQCFETLGLDYKGHEDIVVTVDKIRQIFVHGKGYDTEDLAKKIYTHGTTTISETDNGDGMQIAFGQTTGLSERYYKMVRLLFSQYFHQANTNRQVDELRVE